MKRLLLILLLTFSFQSLAKADDIRDFQIEGMSIGDSLLDHFSEAEIKKMYIVTYPKSKKYIKLGYRGITKLNHYEHVTFHVEENDKRYVIHTINGVMFFANKLEMPEEEKRSCERFIVNTYIY